MSTPTITSTTDKSLLTLYCLSEATTHFLLQRNVTAAKAEEWERLVDQLRELVFSE